MIARSVDPIKTSECWLWRFWTLEQAGLGVDSNTRMISIVLIGITWAGGVLVSEGQNPVCLGSSTVLLAPLPLWASTSRKAGGQMWSAGLAGEWGCRKEKLSQDSEFWGRAMCSFTCQVSGASGCLWPVYPQTQGFLLLLRTLVYMEQDFKL